MFTFLQEQQPSPRRYRLTDRTYGADFAVREESPASLVDVTEIESDAAIRQAADIGDVDGFSTAELGPAGRNGVGRE